MSLQSTISMVCCESLVDSLRRWKFKIYDKIAARGGPQGHPCHDLLYTDKHPPSYYAHFTTRLVLDSIHVSSI